MGEFTVEELNFKDIEVRKAFIKNTPTNMLAGKDFEGRMVIVDVKQGVSMGVRTLNSKGWYEGLEYDKDGNVTDEILEKG